MGQFFDLLMWTIVAAMVVVIVTHGSDSANIIKAFFGGWTSETKILAGNTK